MKKSLILTVAFFLGNYIWADEIQTKDGKKVEFKTLTDEGDHWELTTPQGTKVTVKKADFDKFIPSGVKETPLTGATFTFDKKRKLETINLFKHINPKENASSGSWRFTSEALIGSSRDGVSTIATTYTPPTDEYDVTFAAERKEGENTFYVGLIGGGRQFTINFDWGGGSWSGINMVDGRLCNENGTGINKPFFKRGMPRTITFMIRKTGIVVQADGNDYLSWKADWSRLSLHPGDGVPAKNVLFCGVYKSTFHVTKATVTFPKE